MKRLLNIPVKNLASTRLLSAHLRVISNLLNLGQQVYAVRQRCGRQLAEEAYVEADVVAPIPESATPAALGYALQVPKTTNL